MKMSSSDDALTDETWRSSTHSPLVPQRMVNESYLEPSGPEWSLFSHGSYRPPRMANTSDDSLTGASRLSSQLLSSPRLSYSSALQSSEMGNEGSRSRWYKTKLCPHWINKSCRYGSNCTFAHGESDFRFPAPHPTGRQN